MKKIAAVIALFSLAAIMIFWLGKVRASGSIPTSVNYLGQGGVYHVEGETRFIVKRLDPFRFEFEPGPDYEASQDERVWSVENAQYLPPASYGSIQDFGVVPTGCIVEYSGIDDDLDDRVNRFLLDGETLHTINQGLTFSGRFVVPSAGKLTLHAVDSIGVWHRVCESIATPPPSPTDTPMPTETPLTPTETPIFKNEPVNQKGLGSKLPTTEPTIQPTPAPSIPAPETPMPTATATKKPPRENSCLRINFEISGGSAKKGLYVAQETGGRPLASWNAEEGWQDSGWFKDIDISFPAVFVVVYYYSEPEAPPISLSIFNPAPDSEFGWVARGMCHALEVGWP